MRSLLCIDGHGNEEIIDCKPFLTLANKLKKTEILDLVSEHENAFPDKFEKGYYDII